MQQTWLRTCNLLLPQDSGRQNIREWLPVGIFLDVDRTDVEEGTGLRVRKERIGFRTHIVAGSSPSGAHQLESCKTNHSLLAPTIHVHPDEFNGFEVSDIADGFARIERNAELIPTHRIGSIVDEINLRWNNVHDVVFTHHHVAGGKVHFVFPIPFSRIQGAVLVQIFRIGRGRTLCTVTILRRIQWRISLMTIEREVTLQDSLPAEIGSTEIFVVVTARVGCGLLHNLRRAREGNI